MAESQRPQLDANVITREGQPKPAYACEGGIHCRGNGSCGSGAFQASIVYGAGVAPRRVNQEIFVEALDACLENVEWEYRDEETSRWLGNKRIRV